MPDHTRDNHDESTGAIEGLPEFDSLSDDVSDMRYKDTGDGTTWRPFYLRREILGMFCLCFAAVIGCLETLIIISGRRHGISTGNAKDHYLWTYGPTAFFTVLAALYNRVEYQSKLVAPWQRMADQPCTGPQSILLDYVAQFQPYSVYTSIKNKDYCVSATSAVSIFLKALIILSTGLIALVPIAVEKTSMPMILRNEFVNDKANLTQVGTLPYYFMLGLANGSASYPPGISDDYAYQIVEGNLGSTTEFQVTVDGLESSLQCQPARLDLIEARYYRKYGDQSALMLNVSSPDCTSSSQTIYGGPVITINQSTPFGQFSQIRCDNAIDDSGNRTLLWFGNMYWFYDSSVDASCSPRAHHCSVSQLQTRGKLVGQSVQLLCKPTYNIQRINIVQTGTTVQSLSPVPGAGSTQGLDQVSPWDIMSAHFQTFPGDINEGRDSVIIDNITLDVDVWMALLLNRELARDPATVSISNTSLIQSMATSYYRQFGSILARECLMRDSSIATTGSANVSENRLMVRKWAGQWMASLAAACLLLTLLAMHFNRRQWSFPYNPTSLVGFALIVQRSPDILDFFRYMGDSSSEKIRQLMENSTFRFRHAQTTRPNDRFLVIDRGSGTSEDAIGFEQTVSTHAHPKLLHPALRLALGLLIVSLVITLEITLRTSQRDGGFGDVGDDTYLHYLWTAMPALIFSLLSITLSSMDSVVRSLAPYTTLTKIVSNDAFGNLDLLDMSTPRALWKEAKYHSLGHLATTTTMLVASLFTIFSGSLFQLQSIPKPVPLVLELEGSFGSTNETVSSAFMSSGITSALILLGNASYPEFTYENLAFPKMRPGSPITPGPFSSDLALSTQAIAPAVRLRQVCRVYNDTNIHTNFTATPLGDHPLAITIDQEGCNLDLSGDWNVDRYNVYLDDIQNTSHFGVEDYWSAQTSSCSDHLYVWGWLLNISGDTSVQNVAAMSCNESFEVVDVETNFLGANLSIDPLNPPRPIEETVRDSTASAVMVWYKMMYFYVPSIPNPNTRLFSNLFAMLTSSRWAIQPSELGDPSRNSDVAAAIRFQNSILMAQALNSRRVNAINYTLSPDANMSRHSFPATVTDDAGRRRVTQDPVSTRVLEGLLLATAVLLVMGWVFLPRADVLPDRSATTIASVLALLAGGNLLDFPVADAARRGVDGIQRRLSEGNKFWLGWGLVPDEEGIAMGNENENGVRRFGIYAITSDEEKRSLPVQ